MRSPARLWTTMGAVLSVAVALAQTQSPAQPPRPAELATVLPAGALLVVQARDFASLVRGWEASTEKTQWLASANHRAFSRSRLFLRLQEARDEFSTAAGVPPDMALVSDIAGGESALALYDVGELELLYVTRLPSAKAMENVLWRERGNYEPREAAGTPFYVRADPEQKRIVAFGTRDGYLLLATREDLLAGALGLIGALGERALPDRAQTGSSVAGEGWFVQATAATPSRGDVRLVLNLEAVVKQPHFRSYWIQGNVSELKQYTSGVSDLFLTPGEAREERVLLRAEDTPAANATTLGEIVRLVPETAGLYRAWAAPSREVATSMILSKVLAPGGTTSMTSQSAPTVTLSDGVTGSASDLEARIDEEAHAPRPTGYQLDALTRLVGTAPLTALLHVESTRTAPEAVFVNRGSVIVLARAADWPAGAAREALRAAIEPVWTKAGLGMRWNDVSVGAQRISQLEGLEPLAVAERGRLLFVANDPALLGATLDAASGKETRTSTGKEAGTSVPAAERAFEGTYAAGFRHGVERGPFASLTRLVDRGSASGEDREPLFFSENLVSLSQTLARIESASIVVRDSGARVNETVTYRLRR